jgi:hypothetical protein
VSRIRGAIAPAATLAVVSLSLALASTAAAALTTAGDEEVVMTASQRSSAGLDTWPDGPMGIERNGNGFAFYGANSGNVARTVGPLDDPAASEVSPSIKVDGAKQLTDVRYASGGSVYEAGGGTKLMFIHLERRPLGTTKSWYGSVGLAKSTDDGHTWTFLGEIFRPNLPYSTYKRSQPCGAVVEASFGQYVLRSVGGTTYFYIYSNDTQRNCSANFAVARAPVSAVAQAARRNRVSPWSKYYASGWREPALGGRSSNVAQATGRRSFSVAYDSSSNRYVLAMTRLVSPGVYGIALSESTDGIAWSSPQILFTTVGEVYAPTIVGLGADPTVATQRFYIYYSYSPHGGFGGYRWSDASLRRRLATSL